MTAAAKVPDGWLSASALAHVATIATRRPSAAHGDGGRVIRGGIPNLGVCWIGRWCTQCGGTYGGTSGGGAVPPPSAMHGPWQGSPKDVRITRLFVGETHLYQGSLSTDVSGFEGGFKPMSMHSCLCVCFCRHDCTTQVDAFVVYASWTAMAFCDCLWIVFF